MTNFLAPGAVRPFHSPAGLVPDGEERLNKMFGQVASMKENISLRAAMVVTQEQAPTMAPSQGPAPGR